MHKQKSIANTQFPQMVFFLCKVFNFFFSSNKQIISLGIRHKIPVDYEMRKSIVLTNSNAQKTELPLHIMALKCVGSISFTRWMSKPEMG